MPLPVLSLRDVPSRGRAHRRALRAAVGLLRHRLIRRCSHSKAEAYAASEDFPRRWPWRGGSEPFGVAAMASGNGKLMWPQGDGNGPGSWQPSSLSGRAASCGGCRASPRTAPSRPRSPPTCASPARSTRTPTSSRSSTQTTSTTASRRQGAAEIVVAKRRNGSTCEGCRPRRWLASQPTPAVPVNRRRWCGG